MRCGCVGVMVRCELNSLSLNVQTGSSVLLNLKRV